MEIHKPVGDNSVSNKKRRRRTGKKKATIQIVDQRDVNLEASKIRGDCIVANIDLEMNLLEANKYLRQEIDGGITEKGCQSTSQNRMDIKSTFNLDEGTANAKRKWKRKKVKSKTRNNYEVECRDQSNSMSCLQLSDKSLRQAIDDKLAKNEDVQHTNQDMMDIASTVNLSEGNVNANRKKRNNIKSKVENKDEVLIAYQSHSMSKLQLSEENLRQEICDKLSENVDVPHTDQNKMDVESTVNIAEGVVSAKRKRKRKRVKRKTGKKDELQTMDQSNSLANLQSDNKLRQEIDDKLADNEDVQSIDKKNMDLESIILDIESTVNLTEGIVSAKRKRKSKRVKRKTGKKDELQTVDQSNSLSNLQPDNKLRHEIDDKIAENEDVQSIDKKNMAVESIYNETTILGPSDVKEAECISKDLGEYPSRPPTTTDRRKLLVLDLNGLLAYIVMSAPKDRKGDIHILGRAVFKRPFCDDFLKFCFHNFDVGIWSSRSKKVVDGIVDYLLGNLKQKLVFCWDMSRSTQTGFKTLENVHKPLVCKDLREIWRKGGPKLSWKKGQYDESNTLLLDDSPYKALLNPLHTAIFPHPYHYEDKDDNSLGPGGDLRVYLEGLLKSENVREYVERHPFGQSAINETNVSWQFYSGVIQRMLRNM